MDGAAMHDVSVRNMTGVQIRPHDAFGKVMMRNLEVRACAAEACLHCGWLAFGV